MHHINDATIPSSAENITSHSHPLKNGENIHETWHKGNSIIYLYGLQSYTNCGVKKYVNHEGFISNEIILTF
jgi:hypothetical protein